ncbi:MAG: hypothetical protein P4L45_13295 [Ignavibacteriaceae bacterium]|nr:hypothetical protein [Ignavibacteriaceae bacterium]
MKKHITKILLIPFIGLLFSGCYTALWMPDGDYDSEDIQANEGENFYPMNDYGDYYYFYNRPWWYSAVQTAQAKNNRSKDLNANTGQGGFKRDGRSTSSTGQTSASLPTVSAPAPTVSGSTTTNTSNSSTNRAGDSNSSGNKSNPVRNNDGNRNTSGR